MTPAARQALNSLRSGDTNQALRYLREACEQDPQLAPAEITLANLYKAEGDFANARASLEQAAAQYPNDPEPHLMFADLAWSERRLSDAEVQYERGRTLATSLDGNISRKHELECWALAGSGSVAAARRNYGVAQDCFTALLKLDPTHKQAHTRLGNILFALDRPEEALAQFEAAGMPAEASSAPQLTMATLYLKSGNIDQAMQWVERAIKSDPKDPQPLFMMARLYLQVRNDPEEADQFLDRAAELAPEASATQLLRGLAAWQRGDLPAAEAIFESIVLTQPGNLGAGANLASVLAEQEDPERLRRAWELVELNATNHPESTETAAALGWVAYHRGEWSLAEKQLRGVAALPGASRDVKYYLARCLFRRGQISAATAVLNEALAGKGLFLHLSEATQWQREIKAGKARS